MDILEDWSNVELGVGDTSWSAGFYYNLTQHLRPSELVDDADDPNLDGKSIGEEGQRALELNEDDWYRKILCVDMRYVEAPRD